ncbi:MAG: nuclear transport factor 2 family protein [Pseudomonadota bacterium]|jgi:hypothetical protein
MTSTDQNGLEARIASLESRIRSLEDQVAIYQLLARYAPSVDSRSKASTAALWTADGSYDYGGAPLAGAIAVGGLVDQEPHVGYVAKGSAHAIGMPLVQIDGDRAVATGYSQLYVKQEDGWKVERASANRWELVRTTNGWRVHQRINRMLDGSAEGRELLSQGIGETR